MKLYQQNEIPDGDTGVSWFDLHRIYSSCPAKWRFEERDASENPAITEHAAILNHEEFSHRYVREPSKDDFENCLSSDADIQQWIKSRGIKGYSGKKYDELIEMVDMTGETPFIYRRELEKFAEKNKGKKIVPAKDYDRVMQMRDVLFANNSFAERIEKSFNDILIVGEINGLLIHVKIDCIDDAGNVIDYVGCADANPDAFKMQAIRGGYYLKQALVHDMLSMIWSGEPEIQILAQERAYPYIPVIFDISKKHLEIGRVQYNAAIEIMKKCQAADAWPTYALGSQSVELPIPEYFARQYGVEL